MLAVGPGDDAAVLQKRQAQYLVLCPYVIHGDDPPDLRLISHICTLSAISLGKNFGMSHLPNAQAANFCRRERVVSLRDPAKLLQDFFAVTLQGDVEAAIRRPVR